MLIISDFYHYKVSNSPSDPLSYSESVFELLEFYWLFSEDELLH